MDNVANRLNGLNGLNGLNRSNGLNGLNGLNGFNGLTGVNGLKDNNKDNRVGQDRSKAGKMRRVQEWKGYRHEEDGREHRWIMEGERIENGR